MTLRSYYVSYRWYFREFCSVYQLRCIIEESLRKIFEFNSFKKTCDDTKTKLPKIAWFPNLKKLPLQHPVFSSTVLALQIPIPPGDRLITSEAEYFISFAGIYVPMTWCFRQGHLWHRIEQLFTPSQPSIFTSSAAVFHPVGYSSDFNNETPILLPMVSETWGNREKTAAATVLFDTLNWLYQTPELGQSHHRLHFSKLNLCYGRSTGAKNVFCSANEFSEPICTDLTGCQIK